MHTYMHTYIHTYMCASVHAYICTLVQIFTCTHIHFYTLTQRLYLFLNTSTQDMICIEGMGDNMYRGHGNLFWIRRSAFLLAKRTVPMILLVGRQVISSQRPAQQPGWFGHPAWRGGLGKAIPQAGEAGVFGLWLPVLPWRVRLRLSFDFTDGEGASAKAAVLTGGGEAFKQYTSALPHAPVPGCHGLQQASMFR